MLPVNLIFLLLFSPRLLTYPEQAQQMGSPRTSFLDRVKITVLKGGWKSPWLYAAVNYLITVRLLLLFSTEDPKAMFCGLPCATDNVQLRGLFSDEGFYQADGGVGFCLPVCVEESGGTTILMGRSSQEV